MTEQQPDDDQGDDTEDRAVSRALWGRDDPADDGKGTDDTEDRKPGNYSPREGHPAGPPTPDDDRAFVRDLFDN